MSGMIPRIDAVRSHGGTAEKTRVCACGESMTHRVYSPIVTSYQKERERKERRRRVATRVVGVVIAAAMLISLVVPAIYAGL